MTHVDVIAEAGVNHNGSLDLAIALVDASADAGADVVKFQTFRSDKLVTVSAPKADYQKRNIGGGDSQHEMLKKLELDEAAHHTLIRHCQQRGIAFLSTPFDNDSIDLLVDTLGLRQVKVGSGDMSNSPHLLNLARRDVDMIISTGMASIPEIEEALGVVAYGYGGGDAPSHAAFAAALRDPALREKMARKVKILHCTSDYPASPDEINLAAMDTLAETFGLPVGFSDHSEGIAIAIAAVARGATVIEKHVTLDRTMEGPDHRASIEPKELKAMVEGIRLVERSVGSGLKVPSAAELRTALVARKSLVAARPIAAGEIIDESALAIKRPGTGMSPSRYWDVLGRVASRAYAADDLLAEG